MKHKFNISILIAFSVVLVFGPFVMAQECRCWTCENRDRQRGPEWRAYWQGLQERLGQPNEAGPIARATGASQVVFLEFDSGNDGNLDYTTEIRDAIQDQLEIIYERFDVTFTQKLPVGDFSTLFFNEGFPGGLAMDIDFRNLNPNDTAVLNLDIGLAESQIVSANAIVAAHELGHLLGLRHADMFGPVGEGIISGFAGFYDPVYMGPANAFTESLDHVMATGAFGIPLDSIFTPSWFSERSAVKLIYAEQGVAVSEMEDNDSLESAQALTLQAMKVPNTIVSGMNAGAGDFSVSAIVVEGTLNFDGDQQDVFQISGRAGDLFNLEVLSNIPERLEIDPIDPNLSVFDEQGELVDYYGAGAFNESEIESVDCSMVDLILPNDGTYFIEIDSAFEDSGLYELYVFRFNGVLGDVNGDGLTDLLDVSPFVDAIIAGNYLPNADTNCDGDVNLLDVNSFVALLSGS